MSERRLVTVLCACVALVVGQVAAINLAVPKLAASSLHPSASTLVWIVDSYVVFFACLVIPCGALGDRFGRRPTLQAGLLLVALGSVCCAVAPNVGVLLVGRAVTGIGAACVLPSTLAVIINVVPPERRPRAIGMWAAMTGVGGVLGNAGGGVVLASGSWRALFVAVIPLALGCLGAVTVTVPDLPTHQRPVRPASALLLVLASVALLVGIIEGPQHGWTSGVVLGGFAIGAALFAAWTWLELRATHPMLDPRVFLIRPVRGATIGTAAMFFGLFALFYVNAQYLQYGKGFSVLQTGFAVAPMAVAMLLVSPRAAAVAARFGSRVTLAIAVGLAGSGLLLISTMTTHTPYLLYAAYLCYTAVGLGLALPLLSADISAALPAAQAGASSGLQSTTREFGSALGVAVVGSVLTSRFTSLLPAGVPAGARTVADAVRADPAGRGEIVRAFTSSAGFGLRVAGLVTLLAGAAVLFQLRGRTS